MHIGTKNDDAVSLVVPSSRPVVPFVLSTDVSKEQLVVLSSHLAAIHDVDTSWVANHRLHLGKKSHEFLTHFVLVFLASVELLCHTFMLLMIRSVVKQYVCIIEWITSKTGDNFTCRLYCRDGVVVRLRLCVRLTAHRQCSLAEETIMFLFFTETLNRLKVDDFTFFRISHVWSFGTDPDLSSDVCRHRDSLKQRTPWFPPYVERYLVHIKEELSES